MPAQGLSPRLLAHITRWPQPLNRTTRLIATRHTAAPRTQPAERRIAAAHTSRTRKPPNRTPCPRGTGRGAIQQTPRRIRQSSHHFLSRKQANAGSVEPHGHWSARSSVFCRLPGLRGATLFSRFSCRSSRVLYRPLPLCGTRWPFSTLVAQPAAGFASGIAELDPLATPYQPTPGTHPGPTDRPESFEFGPWAMPKVDRDLVDREFGGPHLSPAGQMARPDKACECAAA